MKLDIQDHGDLTTSLNELDVKFFNSQFGRNADRFIVTIVGGRVRRSLS